MIGNKVIQICLLDIVVRQELRTGAFSPDMTVFQNIRPVYDFERRVHILLHRKTC